MSNRTNADQLRRDWADSPRWAGITRPYSAEEVVRLRGSVQVEHTLARLGAEKFWRLLHTETVVSALGAMTGNQAVEEIQAGLKAIYCSGWQVAGDGNSAGEMYPDQSLYPVDSVPKMVERINNALLRTDQIHHMQNDERIDWLAPVIADAEAGFGGNLNAFELTKSLIRAGAAAVHFEDQLSSAKKCGHMGGKVLVSTQDAINKLVAARFAADVMGVPTVLVARTDADAANLLQADFDSRDARFLTGGRTEDGFFEARAGIEQAIDRGLSYAPYADLIGARPQNRIWPRPSVLQRRSMRNIRASCWPTTAHRPSTGVPTCRSSGCGTSVSSLRRWVTVSSSSRWPAGMRSTCRCSNWPGPTGRMACMPTRICRNASLPTKCMVSVPCGIRPSWAPVTSMRCRR